MQITLPADVQSISVRHIESGRFPSMEDVIAEAVRQMDRPRVPDELLVKAFEEADRGEGRVLAEDVMRGLSQRARAKSRRGHKVRDEVKY